MAAEVAPSQFGRLLRRSKFATFDPSIAQVYTSHSGYAHRGDFGLKRPLPRLARTPHPSVTIKAIDTRQQQTEWALTHPQSKFIRRWEETGATAEVEPSLQDSVWDLNGQVVRRWEVDSEFDQGSNKAESPAMVANHHAMNKTQFKAYVEQLRSLRPQFKRYLDAQRAQQEDQSQPTGRSTKIASHRLPPLPSPLPMSSLARRQTSLHSNFLRDQARQALSDPSSTTIAPKPHPNAGLSYHRSSQLQQWLQHQPAPGRLVLNEPPSFTTRGTFALRKVAIAGVFAQTQGYPYEDTSMAGERKEPALDPQALSKGLQSVDAGVSKYRVRSATIRDTPKVVGRRPTLEGGMIQVQVSEAKDLSATSRMIPHRPGSVEYSAYEFPKVGLEARSMTQLKNRLSTEEQLKRNQKTAQEEKATAEGLSASLYDILGVIDKTVSKE
ncbi:hypothetical protein FRC03_002747 [Tulasnella sp. 419]|nr:hypothetical protein FRC02_000077 [Tulasnella sp. 418]KAG8969471.1 hypothetical protein FRC03_002747 [Tulasnella sp. 419]